MALCSYLRRRSQCYTEKEKMFVTRIFSFDHKVFKRLENQGSENQGSENQGSENQGSACSENGPTLRYSLAPYSTKFYTALNSLRHNPDF